MKTVFTILAFLSISLAGLAQGSNTKDYDELMRKSRSARTISTIMVSTGPVIAAGGIGTLIYGLIQNEIGDETYYYDANGNYISTGKKKYTTEIVVGAAGALVGIGVALGSIAFSNKASDYKRDARRLKLKTSRDNIIIPGLNNSLASTRQYKLSLIVPLGSR